MGAPTGADRRWTKPHFPILLVDLLRREAPSALGDMKRWWSMVRRAAGFIACNGPVTQQDRWEEDAGYSPFTLAVEIAGLLAAADLADAVKEPAIAGYLRELADNWNDNIERWTYSTNGGLAGQIGVDGYYVRIAPPETDCARVADRGLCAHQESTAGARPRAGFTRHQSRCFGAGAFWLARSRRSKDSQHHQSRRRTVASEAAARAHAGIATTTMATANTPMAARLTATVWGVRGRCFRANARITNLMPEIRMPPKNCCAP